VAGNVGDHESGADPPGWQIRSETPSAQPVLLVAAVFSRHVEALEWAGVQLQKEYGPVGLASEVFSFHHSGET
jgi:hypothetical protein